MSISAWARGPSLNGKTLNIVVFKADPSKGAAHDASIHVAGQRAGYGIQRDDLAVRWYARARVYVGIHAAAYHAFMGNAGRIGMEILIETLTLIKLDVGASTPHTRTSPHQLSTLADSPTPSPRMAASRVQVGYPPQAVSSWCQSSSIWRMSSNLTSSPKASRRRTNCGSFDRCAVRKCKATSTGRQCRLRSSRRNTWREPRRRSPRPRKSRWGHLVFRAITYGRICL